MSDSIIPKKILTIDSQWKEWFEVFAAALQLRQDALPHFLRRTFMCSPSDATQYVTEMVEHTISESHPSTLRAGMDRRVRVGRGGAAR